MSFALGKTSSASVAGWFQSQFRERKNGLLDLTSYDANN